MALEKPPLLQTMTNELYQLARLHYRVSDQQLLARKLFHLKCMSFNSEKGCWEWLYEGEARKIGLEVPYEGIPIERRPIILGRLYFEGSHDAHLDVNSFARAVKAVVFFDKHVGKALFEVTDVEILNQLFSQNVVGSEIHAQYFDRQPSPKNKCEVAEEKFANIMSLDITIEEKRAMWMKWSEDEAKKPLEKIERLPVNFYVEDIKHFETSLRMREMIAMQHWLGNKSYSMYDLIRVMIPHGQAS